MTNRFLTIGNSINTAILRSPLHRLMSKSVMLISLQGRKSGKTYTLPVEYHRAGRSITVYSWKSRSWWKNLRGGAPVTMRVRGRDLSGTADIVPASEAEIVAGLRAMYPTFPYKRAAKMASDMVMIQIQVE
jgi:deazaflavin-dependent oxidoreductase (nitroreductase family)